MWILLLSILLLLFIIKKFFNGTFTNLRKSMKGKVIVITGSSAGLGKEAAFQLLQDGADVIFACRDKEKTLSAINEYSKLYKNKDGLERAHFMKLDLTSFEDVFKFFEEFKKKFSKIDILMNNAGHFPTKFSLTKDGIESCFQTNHLSHMLLSFLLLDHFDKTEGKIINLSSQAHQFFSVDYSVDSIKDHEKIADFSDYNTKYYSNIQGRSALYGNTKLANIYFTQYLAEFLSQYHPHIKTASLHPGGVNTEFSRFVEGRILSIVKAILSPLIYLFTKTPIAGAQTQLHLSYMDKEKMLNGGYYADCAVAKVSALALNKEVEKVFIRYSWDLIKGHVPEKYQNQVQSLKI